MFGWLASPSALCRHAPQATVSRRVRSITPRALIEVLPALGSVLYLHAAARTVLPHDLPHGVLVQRAFVPLLSAHWLISTSTVTEDGPREWCECIDAFGRTQARWHLLPDTDYLAWDALTASCLAHEGSACVAKPLRPDCASVVNFRLRAMGALMLLEQQASTTLSSLGGRIAIRIADAESAVLRT